MASSKKIKSIYDLAKETGVSYATVSRVLNGRGSAAEKTRRKVLAAAEKFDFKPKMQARRTTVALVVDALRDFRDSDYHSELFSCLFRHLSARELSIEVYSRHNISKLRSAMIDGVICMPWDMLSKETMAALPKNIPSVMPNVFGVAGCSTVVSDHSQSGRLAASCLLEKGHRAAGVIGYGDPGNLERAKGFFDRFAEAGFPQPPGMFCNMLNMPLGDCVETLLKNGATGLFFASEGRVAELASAIAKLGLKIPDDLSLVAMETWRQSGFQNPPWTTVQQPIDLVASTSIDMLMRKIAAGDSSLERTVLDNCLIERASVAFVRRETQEARP